MLAPGLLHAELRAIPVRPQSAAAAWCAGASAHTRSSRRRTSASGCAARDREMPNSCSMSRRVSNSRSRASSCRMASGMASSHCGLAGPGRAFRLHLLLRVRVGEEVGPAPLEVRQARQVVFCSRCANADAVSSPMSLFERGRLDAVAGSWPGCGRAKRLSQKRLSQRSVPSSPNRAYRMPRCSRYSTAARIWRQRPTSFSRRFQATLEHRWRGPRRRAGPQMLRAVVLAQGQEPLRQGDRGKLAHARTSCPESWRGGPATNVADVARGQPAPPA